MVSSVVRNQPVLVVSLKCGTEAFGPLLSQPVSAVSCQGEIGKVIAFHPRKDRTLCHKTSGGISNPETLVKTPAIDRDQKFLLHSQTLWKAYVLGKEKKDAFCLLVCFKYIGI